MDRGLVTLIGMSIAYLASFLGYFLTGYLVYASMVMAVVLSFQPKSRRSISTAMARPCSCGVAAEASVPIKKMDAHSAKARGCLVIGLLPRLIG